MSVVRVCIISPWSTPQRFTATLPHNEQMHSVLALYRSLNKLDVDGTFLNALTLQVVSGKSRPLDQALQGGNVLWIQAIWPRDTAIQLVAAALQKHLKCLPSSFRAFAAGNDLRKDGFMR